MLSRSPISWKRLNRLLDSRSVPDAGFVERVLVLYGAIPLEGLLSVQESGIDIIFGHQVETFFQPSGEMLAPVEEELVGYRAFASYEPASPDQSSVSAGQLSPARPSPASTRTAESVIRTAADLIGKRIPDSRLGRLGRRKGHDASDPYVSQYVHFETPREGRFALWLYYAGEGHEYSVPGFPSGFWAGLKRDAAQELPRDGWEDRLENLFEWMHHVDDKYSGFRHFFKDSEAPPVEALPHIVGWSLGALEELGLIPPAD